jgi:uncharacterized membrane protein
VANRIVVKKSLDERGNEKHAYEWIKDYLRLEGEKRFGEIKQYLADHGIRYASDKGLDLALKSLIESEEIGKHRSLASSYPVYYIRKKESNRISILAQRFQHEMNVQTNFIKLPRQTRESEEEYFIRNLIHTYGIYTLFVLIKGWKLTSNKKSHSENHEILNVWQNHTLPIGNESFFLENGITELVEPGFGYAYEPVDSVYKLYANKKKWNKLLEIEELFKKMYPNHVKFFEESLVHPTVEEPKTLKKLIKMARRETKKNHIIKNKKLRS